MQDPLSQELASLRIERAAPPSRSPWVLRFVVLAALAGGGFLAYRLAAPEVEARLWEAEVAGTEVSTYSPAQASVEVTSTGYVVPQVVAKVGAKIVGRLQKVALREGETVKAGQVLFELDPLDQKSAVATARARAASSRARVQTAKAALREVDVQLQRQKRLLETGSVAPATVEDLETRHGTLAEQLKAAEADAQAADAEAEALNVGLRNLTVVAPIDGAALTKPAQVGDVVSPGTLLVELADLSTLLVETDVPEGRLHLIKPGGPCEVVLDAIPSERFRGEVAEVGPKINRAKATATVKVRLVDRPELLRPDMSARVSFLSKALDESQRKQAAKIVVPAAAVAERDGQKVVFTIDGGKVRRVPVTVGGAVGGGLELLNGPRPGTRLVKDPPATMADGQAIKEKTS